MTQPDLPGSPIVSARNMIVLPPRRPVLVHRPDDADLPVRPPTTRAPASALLAASLLQADSRKDRQRTQPYIPCLIRLARRASAAKHYDRASPFAAG